MIRIIANGQPRELPEPMSVARFLEMNRIHPQAVAVELRGQIVPREKFPEALIQDGDHIEVVRMMGGGLF